MGEKRPFPLLLLPPFPLRCAAAEQRESRRKGSVRAVRCHSDFAYIAFCGSEVKQVLAHDGGVLKKA